MRRRLFEGDRNAVRTFASVDEGARGLDVMARSVAYRILFTAELS